jgi:hypothetical protein
VTHDKYNLNFDTATADKYEGDQCLELMRLIKDDLSLALMMTPLELAYFTGDNSFVLEIKTIAPVDKNNTRIAWIIASGVHTENRYLNSVLKEADINAQFSPAMKKLLNDIFHKPIETALGMALFRLNSPTRMCTIEWLLSNGAKFSENEVSFIAERWPMNAGREVKKVLFASENQKYSVLKNVPIKLDPEMLRDQRFKKCKKSNRDRFDLNLKAQNLFSFFMKGGEYVGKWRLEGTVLICQSETFVQRIFSGGSWGGFSDKVTKDNTEFKYNVLTTSYDSLVLTETDSKIKTPTFNNLMKLYWCETYG